MNSSKDTAPSTPNPDDPAPAAPGASPPAAAHGLWGLFAVAAASLVFVAGWAILSSAFVGQNHGTGRTPPSAEVQAASRRAKQCQQNDDEAGLERELLVLIGLQPDEISWRLNLCDLYIRQGRTSSVIETCRASLARNFSPEDSDELRARLANEMIKLGNAAEGRAALEPMRAHSPQHSAVIPLYAQLLRLEGDSEGAVAYLHEMMPAEHEDASIYQVLGSLEFDLGRYEDALRDFRESARIDPYSDATFFKLAECARLLGDRDAEQGYRKEYARLHGTYREIDTLTSRHHREQTLSDQDAARLARLYEATGQTELALYWRNLLGDHQRQNR